MTNAIPTIPRFQDLQKLFKVSRSSLDRWEAKNAFPKRINIGENSVGWRSDEIQQWLQDRSNTSQEG
jgi:predicted DNA-binding transcriptional regulator AlpA